MIKTLIIIGLFCTAVIACTQGKEQGFIQLTTESAVIYNGDSRQDISPEQSSSSLVNATAMLIKAKKISLQGNQWIFKILTLSDSLPLCEDENFLNQPVLGFCSGVLISADEVLTAGHCMKAENACEETKFVFGWDVTRSTDSIKDDEVFHCQKIQAFQYKGINDIDYAIVKLDRAVTKSTPVTFAKDLNFSEGTKLTSFSYPLGLPLKTDIATVVENKIEENLFKADVDTFGGSSGSPLFNADGELVGILNRGMEDILEDDIYQIQTYGGCLNFNRCKDHYCTGESFLKVKAIKELGF